MKYTMAVVGLWRKKRKKFNYDKNETCYHVQSTFSWYSCRSMFPTFHRIFHQLSFCWKHNAIFPSKFTSFFKLQSQVVSGPINASANNKLGIFDAFIWNSNEKHILPKSTLGNLVDIWLLNRTKCYLISPYHSLWRNSHDMIVTWKDFQQE